jgi:uncharacterized protein YndB with AHSA1/START domain
MRSAIVILLLGALLPLLAAAQSPWLQEPAVRERLAAGEVVVRAEPDGRHVAAAVRIRASTEAVWGVLTDCEAAAQFIPDLKSCRRLESAPDGSWEDIAREFKYSWFMPTVRDIVRTEYHKPERIEFQRISGDFKDERGAWVLAGDPDGSATVLEYRFYVDLGFWLPRAFLQHSLRSELPAAMKAVRTRAEAGEPAPPAR